MEVTDADRAARIAYAQAIGAIRQVFKTQTADTGKYTYRYADLGDILEECNRVCDIFGLTFDQVPTVIDGMLAIRLTFFHVDGGVFERDPLMMVLPKEAQAYGSALTYGRRYQLMSVFRIAPEDDDGRAATVAAQTQPGRRTEAERMIRESIAQLDEDTRKRFTAAFKEHFHVTLTDLPAARHGEALQWSREWRDEDRPVEKAAGEASPEPASGDDA